MYDLIIIGLGPAGMSAAIYAKRAGLNVLALEASSPGGLLLKVKNVNNYLGFKNIKGIDLALQMFEHFSSFEIPYKITEVMEIENQENKKLIKTNTGNYEAKTVLITTGRNLKKLDLDDEFLGKEVSYCVVCDAPLYKNKDVLYYTDENIEDAYYLSDIANKVYFASEKKYNLKIKENIEVLSEVKIKKIKEEDNRKEVTFNNGKHILVDGIFINLKNSKVPNFYKSLDISDENSKIIVNQNQETKIEGIYAAGDVVKKEILQIANAVSEGMSAALEIKKYVKEKVNKL